MKSDTKRNIIVGAVVLGGAYFLMQDGVAAGGFGGGGGIPLLPGDVEDAAEGDTVINYVLGGGEDDPFGGFGGDPATKKSSSVAPTVSKVPFVDMVKGATPTESVFLGMATTAVPHPMTLPDSKKGKDVRILDIKEVSDKPIQWDEASVGGFFDFLAPLTQLGKGAMGRSSVYDTPSLHGAVNVKATSRAVTTHQIAQRQAIGASYSKKGAGSSGRYWRVNGSHAPGWKQIGAKAPTAPGQPDRY